MKILFVNPPFTAWVTHGKHRAANQFYAQLIAYIRHKKVAEPFLVDARGENLSMETMIAKIKKLQPEVVFLGEILHSTCGFAPVWYFLDAARRVKEIAPQAKVVVGGLWFSAMYEDTLKKYPYIDFLIVGEAELTLEELLLSLKAGQQDFSNIAGLASRRDGTIVVGPHRELIKDLNILPIPAYDLFPMRNYVGHTYWKPFAELMVSRGCPGGCVFCYEWSMYDPRCRQDFISWRIKSPERILDELEELNKKYQVKVVVFQDDAFNVNKTTVEEVCRGMIRRDIKMNWVILGRADDWVKQLDILPLMKEAGMFMALLGVEVDSDEELQKIGKGVNTHQIMRTFEALRTQGIMSIGCFMVGFEDDDEVKIRHRFEFADQADPDIFALQFLTPAPGSPLWNKYVDRGWINLDTLDLRKWDMQHPVVPTKYLSIEDVGRLGAWCMKEFFGNEKRVERLVNGPYHELAKLCVKDFMDHITGFETGATDQDANVQICWETGAREKFKRAIEKMPFFQRKIVQRLVSQRAESLVKKAKRREVCEKDMVDAFFLEVPSAFKGMMKNLLKEVGIDYEKYGYEK